MKSKTKLSIVALVTAVVLVIGVFMYQGQDNINKNHDNLREVQGRVEQNIRFPKDILQIDKEGIVSFGYIDAKVKSITDGDTFYIAYKGSEYKVRMLDVDTPESVKVGVEPQPYSKEASDLSKNMLLDKEVRLIFEKGVRDQYDRLLAHVILKDETYYNAFLVQNGYAICVFYSPNTKLRSYFNEIQEKAINGRKGFWNLDESKRPFILDSKGKYIAVYKEKEDAA